MENIINEYVSQTETLLLSDPQSKLIKSFLKELKSLKDLPSEHLQALDDVVPLVYESLSDVDNDSNINVIMKLFFAMTTNIKLAVEAKI